MSAGAMLVAMLALAGERDLKVQLVSPRPGWTQQRVVWVQGTVSDKRITTATVTLNNTPLPISVQGGRFEVRLLLQPGESVIEVAAHGEQGQSQGQTHARDAVRLFAQVPPIDLEVMLSWDTLATDLDLRVTDPSGEECDFGHRRSTGEGPRGRRFLGDDPGRGQGEGEGQGGGGAERRHPGKTAWHVNRSV